MNIEKLNVIVAAHIYSTGPALELETYIYKKCKKLYFIGHPFVFRSNTRSFTRKYENGKLLAESYFPGIPAIGTLFYLRDFILTFFWIMKEKKTFDLYIGSDNMLTFVGLILKKFGKVKNVVLYTIDYSPKRFSNKLFNKLYHFFDYQCLTGCNLIWNVSKTIGEGRKKYWGQKSRYFVKQITVPLGVWLKRIPKIPLSKKKKTTMMFMGHLLEKQGLQMIVKALPEIKKQIPGIKLIIIGDGEYRKKLENLVFELKLESIVTFMGYVKDHRQVETILSQGVLGLATYKPDKNNFSYFADPGKIKNYLACGLPVILTRVPSIYREIEKKKCGIIVDYDSKSAARSIFLLLKNKEKLNIMVNNAYLFIEQFDWDIIFEKAINETLSNLVE